MKKKQIKKEIDWIVFFAFIRWYILGKWADYMTFLTRFEPFSLLSDTYIFHYKNRKYHKVRDAIWEKYYIPSAMVDRDAYFFYMFINKTRITSDTLKGFLKDTDVLITEQENYIKIAIPRK